MASPTTAVTELKTTIKVTGRGDVMPSINWQPASGWEGDPWMVTNGKTFSEVVTGRIEWTGSDVTEAALELDTENLSTARLIILHAETDEDFDGSWGETEPMFAINNSATGVGMFAAEAGTTGGHTDALFFNDKVLWTGCHPTTVGLGVIPFNHGATEGKLYLYYFIAGDPA